MAERSILVVGGGSGIGLEITRRLVERGDAVRVWARSEERPEMPEAAQYVSVDVTGDALFLLDETASWMTGQVLAVDGGMGSLRTFR